MVNKLLFLTKTSLNRKIKTKWFLITNILLVIIISCVINMDSIINLFGGDFNKSTKIYVVDNTEKSYDLLKSNLEKSNNSISSSDKLRYNIKKSNKSKDKLVKNLKENEIVLIINDDKENTLDVSLISLGYINTIDYQILSNAINNTKIMIAIDNSNIDYNDLNNIYKEVNIKRELLDKNLKSEDENMEMIMTTVFPIVILPFFMLSLILIQLIGSEVNDEKSTRGMEIIISNVSYKTHFFSKVIAGNLFVILQGLLLVVYCLIGFLIKKLIPSSGGIDVEVVKIINSISITGFVNKLVYIIPITLFLMLLTFIAYSLVAGILASMTTNAEDFNQLQTPIIIISLIGYYLSMMAGVFKGALFIRILSYFPFISAILSPSLLVLGQIGIIDMVISIIIVIITILILTKYGLRIYKEGILNYSSKDLWKKMFKAIKN